MWKRMMNEPVALSAALRAVMLAGMAFGLHLTVAQLAAVMLAVEMVLALLTRANVTPNQLAEQRVALGGSPTVPHHTE